MRSNGKGSDTQNIIQRESPATVERAWVTAQARVRERWYEHECESEHKYKSATSTREYEPSRGPTTTAADNLYICTHPHTHTHTQKTCAYDARARRTRPHHDVKTMMMMEWEGRVGNDQESDRRSFE